MDDIDDWEEMRSDKFESGENKIISKQIAQIISLFMVITGIALYLHAGQAADQAASKYALASAFGLAKNTINNYELMKTLGIIVAIVGGIMFVGYVNQEIKEETE